MRIEIGDGQLATAGIWVTYHEPFDRFNSLSEIPLDLTFSFIANGLIKQRLR